MEAQRTEDDAVTTVYFDEAPPCLRCTHPADSHDEEFGNCMHLRNPYGMNQVDGCDCPGYEEGAYAITPANQVN